MQVPSGTNGWRGRRARTHVALAGANNDSDTAAERMPLASVRGKKFSVLLEFCLIVISATQTRKRSVTSMYASTQDPAHAAEAMNLPA